MDSSSKPKNQNLNLPGNFKKRPAILEGLRDIGSNTTQSIKEDLVGGIPKDFMNQFFGSTGMPKRQVSGEISAGEQLIVNDLYSGKHQKEHDERKQIFFERTLLREERILVEKKTNELKIKLQQITDEIKVIAVTLPNTAEEIQTAQMQASVDPGIYHINFFDKILEFLKNFRKNISHANNWMVSANRRASKKNYWGRLKTGGAKYMLSGEHYSQRSAG